jgi:class 3 adenylate cyclase
MHDGASPVRALKSEPGVTVETIPETAILTFLFTDIEGSTRLWEQEPEPMRRAVARHDALSREAVLGEGGRVVKSTGDGLHAVFTEPAQALRAALRLQLSLAGAASARGPGGEIAASGAPGGQAASSSRCAAACTAATARRATATSTAPSSTARRA